LQIVRKGDSGQIARITSIDGHGLQLFTIAAPEAYSTSAMRKLQRQRCSPRAGTNDSLYARRTY
jgi:hypothetical protein